MATHELDVSKIRDISADVLDSDGRIRVLPAAFWAGTTPEERALFGHRHGTYSFPTVELVSWLRELLDGRSAIEIGAGNGAMAAALKIPATDSRMQEKDEFKLIWLMTGQPAVRYGINVRELHASAAVRKYRPDVVIGCWVTHKWEKAYPEREGNAWGVDERDVMNHCRTFVLIGNEEIHQYSRIWDRNPVVEYPSWLYSRAMNGTRDFIAVWNSKLR